MIGLIEACQHSGATVFDVARNPHVFSGGPIQVKKLN